MSRPVTSAAFVISAVQPRDFPTDGLPEIAMVGRSNVGKSSLINALLRKDIARTSSTPGKTRLVNVYRIAPGGAGAFYLVDLPGYGHAGGGEKARQEFARLTALYFATAAAGGPDRTAAGGKVRPTVCGAVLAIDARHPGLATDVDALKWLLKSGIPTLLVATKADKLSQSERATLARQCEQEFGQAPLAASAVKGDGLDELWRRMLDYAKGP